MKKLLGIIVLGLLLVGCAPTGYNNVNYTIQNTAQIQSQISLGDLKSSVVPMLAAQQSNLASNYLKPADQFMKDGKTMYIYYQRSGHVNDGRNTDDEFTPYVFENEKLIAIGWASLGGPKVFASGSGSGSMTIYDPVRDNQNQIDKGMKMLSGGCTLGIDC